MEDTKKECLICGKAFEVKGSSIKRKFCSLLCRNKSYVGKEPWNKNIPFSLASREKMSKSKKGKPSKRKGTSTSVEARNRCSLGQKKRYESQEVWNKGKEHSAILGDKNPNWKGGISEKDKLERSKFRKTLQKIVFKRDKYTCQDCLEKGGFLQVDHIKNWSDFPDLRMELDNCKTLCMSCHYKKTFGKPLPEGVTWGHNFKKAERRMKS